MHLDAKAGTLIPLSIKKCVGVASSWSGLVLKTHNVQTDPVDRKLFFCSTEMII
jgi:hypothetical protein